ncbi:hypothetical protein HGRIS_013217 [Hohenbuehelia grisea]|uniref:Etoposide-induced protein 2.4-domain-containing protein n=1 Tax=Hohenbuehelia grisea TaxID=104357 RepID=A0ABR3IUS4_9AGAR
MSSNPPVHSRIQIGSVGTRSARAAYPTFLSLQESLHLQALWAWRGLYDAFRWNVVFSMVSSDNEIRANVYKSLLLNSLSLISIYTFDFLLNPLVQDRQQWFHRNIGWFYQALWLGPVVGVSFYLNSSWCTLIAKRTFVLHKGQRATAPQSSTYSGMLKAVATSAYRVVMVFTSVIISFALRNIPVVGSTASFIFLCWVDAYYCFEFVWMANGLSLSRRILHLEERWAYYFAFGLPSSALCTWGSGLANAAIFALTFPAYIIMAMHARPVPRDPYNPTSDAPTVPQGTQDDSIRHPSPLVPIRLPIFTVVLWLNDWIVRILSVGGGGGGKRTNNGRSRALSDTTTQFAEEGAAVELMPQTSPRRFVGKGGRKLD